MLYVKLISHSLRSPHILLKYWQIHIFFYFYYKPQTAILFAYQASSGLGLFFLLYFFHKQRHFFCCVCRQQGKFSQFLCIKRSKQLVYNLFSKKVLMTFLLLVRGELLCKVLNESLKWTAFSGLERGSIQRHNEWRWVDKSDDSKVLSVPPDSMALSLKN